MANLPKGGQRSHPQRFEQPVHTPSFAWFYRTQIGNITRMQYLMPFTAVWWREKRLQLLKIKVVAQEANVFFSMWKPSQTSNPSVNTHIEAEIWKRNEILCFKLVELQILHGGMCAVNLVYSGNFCILRKYPGIWLMKLWSNPSPDRPGASFSLAGHWNDRSECRRGFNMTVLVKAV